MMLPDVNVLIYAFRSNLPQHASCRPWLEKVVGSPSRFGIAPLALAAVVRITTNPRLFRVPSEIEEAFAYCNNLLGQPHCQTVVPGEDHFGIFRRTVLETRKRAGRG